MWLATQLEETKTEVRTKELCTNYHLVRADRYICWNVVQVSSESLQAGVQKLVKHLNGFLEKKKKKKKLKAAISFSGVYFVLDIWPGSAVPDNLTAITKV